MMAKATGISVSSVQRIMARTRASAPSGAAIQAFERSRLRRQNCAMWSGSTSTPPAHAIVLSVDEKSQIQALDRTQPGLPMKKGRLGTMTDSRPARRARHGVGGATSGRNGPPPITRTTFPTCRAQYPRWIGTGAYVGCFPIPRGLPRFPGGSASTISLSRPAQTSLALRPAGSLNRPRRPLSRGFETAGYPTAPLVSYQINRQLSGWYLPPLVIRAFGAHVESRKGAVVCTALASLRFPSPLIKPDVRISRIRLSDWLHPEAHGGGPR